MKLAINVPKGNALPIGNSIRQMGLARSPSWRPVAFSLDRNFNMLNATPEVVEDMISAMSNITSLVFTPKRELTGEFLKESFTFTGSLSKENMVSQYFDISGLEGNLLTVLDEQPATLTIIYRYSVGLHSSLENTDFITRNHESPAQFKALSSRHSGVDEFTFDVSESSLEEEKLIITINSEVGDERDLLNESVKMMMDALSDFNRLLNEKPASKYEELIPPKY